MLLFFFFYNNNKKNLTDHKLLNLNYIHVAQREHLTDQHSSRYTCFI